MRGTIVTWFDRRGFGFLRPDDSPTEIFVHVSDVAERASLQINDRVSYELGSFGGRPKATKVQVLR
jgi:cold shock CspA family protein